MDSTKKNTSKKTQQVYQELVEHKEAQSIGEQPHPHPHQVPDLDQHLVEEDDQVGYQVEEDDQLLDHEEEEADPDPDQVEEAQVEEAQAEEAQVDQAQVVPHYQTQLKSCPVRMILTTEESKTSQEQVRIAQAGQKA